MAELFEPLYTAAEMEAAEKRFPGYPESVPELMERAGAAVAVEAMRAFPAARRFAVVCGGGSNGGDGRVAARLIRATGRGADETTEVEGCDVVVDALFGTGFHGAPRPEAADLIRRINAADAPVVSVDLPSGVDASTGEIEGEAVEAALTVTFHAPKVGIAVAPGRFRAGAVVVADIGLDPVATEHRSATPTLLDIVPLRGPTDSKYTAGSVIVIGGQPGMTGAAVLAAEAALRSDAGYVTLAVPRESLPVVEQLTLEPVKIGWTEDDGPDAILAAAARAGAAGIGPGLGRSASRRALVRELLERLAIPVVVDADALDGLTPVERAAPTVLTPHAGELARLLGKEAAWVDEHRLEAAHAAADRYGAVVLLKGADTIIVAPGRKLDAGPIICGLGPPSLATAGSGDVLSGIVCSFLAKGLEPQLAAAAAAVAHARAADLAPQSAGLVAGDLLVHIPEALERRVQGN